MPSRDALRRVQVLETRLLPAPPDPHLFFTVVDASGEPESDDGDEAAPECPVFGYRGSQIGGGAPTVIKRLENESLEELRARCSAQAKPHLWMPIIDAGELV